MARSLVQNKVDIIVAGGRPHPSRSFFPSLSIPSSLAEASNLAQQPFTQNPSVDARKLFVNHADRLIEPGWAENLSHNPEPHMFGKTDLIDSLSRDLGRTRERRDALASEVTTLTAEIAVLEARISAENDRRERERAANEIEVVKNGLKVQHLALVPVITGMRNATQAAAAIAADAQELDDILMVIATEVGNAIDRLSSDLDRRIDVLRAGHAAPEPEPSSDNSSALPSNDRVFRLPEWLPRKRLTKNPIEHQCSTAAA